MSFFSIIQAVLPLLLIVALLYGALYFVKKYGIKFNNKGSKLVQITVVANQMIAPKKLISIVKIQDKLLVLGVSENAINLLKELESDSLPLDESNIIQNKDDDGFMKMLRKNMGLK